MVKDQATPPGTEPAWTAGTPPPAPAAVARPGPVTAAGITLIVLGIITILLGLLLLVGVGLFAGAAGSAPEMTDMPGMGGMLGAFAGAILVITLLIVAIGALQLVTGMSVLGGRAWARITGIVLGIIGGVFALAGIGQDGGVIVNVAFAIANGYVVYALATTGNWFTARS